MNEIILVGSGGHARACIDVIELTGQFRIVGLIEKDEDSGSENLGYPIIGTDNDLMIHRKKYNNALIAIGQIKSPDKRVKLFQLLLSMDFILPSIISPKAYVSKYALIGEGTIIMHGAIINANARIGRNCIINTNTLIEHDVNIGDHCHIATGANINGGVSVGNKTFIGSGVITNQGVSIGSRCIIGAGAVLKNDVKSNKLIKH